LTDVGRFLKQRQENQRNNVDIGWTGIFTFPLLLKVARFYGYAQVSDDQIKLLEEVRNRVLHSDRNLVTQYADIQMLIEARQLAESLVIGIA
jgi:hypothetical protein